MPAECPWIICEHRDRWQRAMQHFASGRDPRVRFRVQLATLQETLHETRQAAVSGGPIVVLWEIPAQESQEILATIQSLSRLRYRPLQIVTFATELGIPTSNSSRLELQLRFVGADLVIRNPEDLRNALRLAVRYALQRTALADDDLEN